MTAGLRLAVGLLTAVPVGDVGAVDREVAKRALWWFVPVGAALGAAGSVVLVLAERLGLSSLTAAALAFASLAILTRGLHLDGLADTADGLGSRRSADRALAVMRASDIGPFGVAALVLVLFIQVTSLAEASWRALLVAVVIGRLSILVCCSRRVPAARTDGLGVLVAGTASWPLLVITACVVAGGAFLAVGWVGLVALLLALVAAALLVWHSVHRLGGITGDVIGAAVELTTTLALLVMATG
ncbi:MAG TPA: adenosylcobinamide-GDP ribazoletransferase [Actinomycetes bacterium]|nr:adenosylcobinamide-GDP ribazoletransferase [Actinomycetes bacterium]